VASSLKETKKEAKTNERSVKKLHKKVNFTDFSQSVNKKGLKNVFLHLKCNIV